MPEDNCLAKKLQEEFKKNLINQNVADEEKTHKLREEWIEKLTKDLCCLTYKYRVKKWSWRKLDYYYEDSKIESKPELEKHANGCVNKILYVNLPNITIYKWRDYVNETWTQSSLFGDSLHYKLVFRPNGFVTLEINDSCKKEVFYDDFLKVICKELAEYSANIDYGYNPRG